MVATAKVEKPDCQVAESVIHTSEFRDQLFQVVDAMGEASAKAQNLHGAITSGRKMTYSDHTLYIMKDPQTSSKGAVVGFLKIGTKKLFVYDSQGVHHELEPMCVLDFYVHESRQRTGCGHRLFEYMLQDQNTKPAKLAIDKPSHKFSQFLIKHYHLKATIPQVNNFVIFTGFFLHDKSGGANSAHKNAAGRPPMNPYRKQYPNVNTLTHQNGYTSRKHYEAESDVEKKPSPKLASDNVLGEVLSTGHKTDLYNTTAWYRVPPRFFPKPPTTKKVTHENSGGEATATQETHVNSILGPENSGAKPSDSDNVLYSRNMLNPASPLPDIGQTHDSRPNSIRKVPSPPLRRKGHPGDFKNILNTHQDTYDRFGHLKTSPLQPNVPTRNKTAPLSIRHDPRTLITDAQFKPNTEALTNGFNGRAEGNTMDTSSNQINSDVLLPRNFTPYKELNLPPGDPYSSRISAKKLNNTGWNIFGVPQEPRSYSSVDRWKNTRPW